MLSGLNNGKHSRTQSRFEHTLIQNTHKQAQQIAAETILRCISPVKWFGSFAFSGERCPGPHYTTRSPSNDGHDLLG